MSYQTIAYERIDNVGTLMLNRPNALNAMNEQMAGELLDALNEAACDPVVRALLLTGAGRAFCSGQDLKAIAGTHAPATLGEVLDRTWNPLVRTIHQLGKPVVCAVNGVAAGAGASLALACDIRIASDEAAFVIVFSKVGLIPDAGATWTLPRLVGLGKALELAYTAEPVGAEEALRIGLVNRVVQPDSLVDASRALATRLAAGPTAAYALTRKAMDRALLMTFAQALVQEAELQTQRGYSEDYSEGLAAFVEKRTPVFKGR